jgi:histidine triad (HIT) family protein
VSDCPFCARIVAGEYDDDLRRFDAVSFEPLNPVTEGHRLVVPRTHVRGALGHVAIAADVMAAAVLVALNRGITECNFITSAGAAATQTVPHLHIHLVPRREGDGLHLPWTGQQKQEPEEAARGKQ